MPIELKVPALGESVTEAAIARWFIQEGDLVSQEQPLCEIESDKVNVELPSPSAGRLLKILKNKGESVKVGEIIGLLEASGEASVVAPVAGTMAPAEVMPAAPAAQARPELPLSPAVRRIVTEEKVDPSQVTPTGPGGRILKGDVLAHVEARAVTEAVNQAVAQGGMATPAAPRPAPAPEAPKPARANVPDFLSSQLKQRSGELKEERVRMSPLRRKVAERLVGAQRNAAILTTFNEIDMSAMMDLRARFQERFVERYGIKLGFMSFFVKAAVDALKAYPAVNAELDGDEIVYKHHYDIGVAVGGGKGLVVPVVREADRRSFAEIELNINELAKKAKDNKLTLEDLSGGTFTISNGGVYGSLLSTPILNPPQTGILGMHKIQDRPVVVDGQIVIRPMMYVALSYDHRLIDGREAVSFLVRVKECIEYPQRILLEV